MRIVTFISILLIGVAALTAPVPGHCSEAKGDAFEALAGLDTAIYSLSNTLDRFDGSFDQDRTDFFAAPFLNLKWADTLTLFLGGDVQWTRLSNPIGDVDYDEEGWDTEWTLAYVNFHQRAVSINLGLQPTVFGSSLITFDNAPAVNASVTVGKWSMTIDAGQVMDSSPMAALKIDFHPGLFERISLFGTWFRDDENAFAQTLPALYQLLQPTSDGTLWWAGVDADLFVGPLFLTATLIYEQGDIRFKHSLGETQRDVAAYLGDIGLEGNLNEQVGLGFFFFVASGDNEARSGTIHAFLSPLSYNTRAAIFFNPDWLGRDADHTMTFGGATISGVMAPGVHLTYTPVDQLLLDLTIVTLYPHEAPEGRDYYGWEIDLETIYSFSEHVDLILEAARFEHGNYFNNRQGHTPDASVLLSAGLRLHF